jgi:hypothetical protein
VHDGTDATDASGAAGPAGLKVSGTFLAVPPSVPGAAAAAASSKYSAMNDAFTIPAAASPSMPLPPPSGPKPHRTAPAPTTAASTLAAEASASSTSDSGDGMPTADLIARAKAKRLQLRQAHIAPDYVPSEGAQFRGAKDFKKAEEAIRKGSDGDDDSDDGTEAADALRLKFTAQGACSQLLLLCRTRWPWLHLWITETSSWLVSFWGTRKKNFATWFVRSSRVVEQ